jgi:hypothetical protein
MNLKFEINKKYLFYDALLQNIDIDGWVDLQNELWEKYNTGYRLLQGRFYEAFIQDNPENYMTDAVEESKILVNEGMKSVAFQNLLKDTNEYKTWLEKEWNKNKEKIIATLKDILRIEIPSHAVKVLVVSNKMKNGYHLDKGVFAWGHSEDWPNYSMVYLCHEFLHDIIESSDLTHAIIELIADNEMRIRLNGYGEYLYINGKYIGHKNLLEMEKEMLPDWKNYLANKSNSIYDFIDDQKNKQKQE